MNPNNFTDNSSIGKDEDELIRQGSVVKAPTSINIHENYVDWNHNKREKMLKDLLNELDIKIQVSREKLELASTEKKKQLELLVSYFGQHILPCFNKAEKRLQDIKARELQQRKKLEAHTEVTNDLKVTLKNLISPASAPRKNYNIAFSSVSSTATSPSSSGFSFNNCKAYNNSGSNIDIPILTGALYKRSDHLELWRKRWFELTPRRLNYFYNETASVKRNVKPRGCINIHDIIDCSLVHPNIKIHNPIPLRNTDTPLKMKKTNLPQILVIRSEMQTYILASPTYRESLKWVNKVNELMENCTNTNASDHKMNTNAVKGSSNEATDYEQNITVDTSFDSVTALPSSASNSSNKEENYNYQYTEITRETLDSDFKICANNLEAAKTELEESMQVMLKIIEDRETSVQIIQSIEIAIECVEISCKAFPNALKTTCKNIIAKVEEKQIKGNKKKRAKLLQQQQQQQQSNGNSNKIHANIFLLNDLLLESMQFFEKNVQKLLSIDVEQHAPEAIKIYSLLKDLHEADTNKRSEWETLEELVVQRARAEVRYRDLLAHVKEFHVIKSPVRTSFIAKNMMESFNQQGFLSPLPKNKRYNARQRKRNNFHTSNGNSNQTSYQQEKSNNISNNSNSNDSDRKHMKYQSNDNNTFVRKNKQTSTTVDDGFFDIAL
jgi:hypothetical protein